MKFLSRCFATASTPIQPAQVKPLAEVLASLLEDGFEGARNEAATCFGYLMKMVGERPLNATMDNIAEIRKAKIKEAFVKATVKCKVASAAPVPRTSAAPPTKKAASASKPIKQEIAQEDVAPPVAPKAVSKPAVCHCCKLCFVTEHFLAQEVRSSFNGRKETSTCCCSKTFWKIFHAKFWESRCCQI